MIELIPGLKRGRVQVPRSKSHEHRLLIADFLAGDCSRLTDSAEDSADILATKRCLRALNSPELSPRLDCGESGSTRRFLSPLAAALGKRPIFVTAGRLAARPQLDYETLSPGRFELAGDVSSQFVTALLFALPLLKGESQICFLSPLESRGYVDMTLQVLAGAGIRVEATSNGFRIPGKQVYHAQKNAEVEGDWSSAAFWLAMNALGSEITVEGLSPVSAQPDRAVIPLLDRILSVRTGGRVSIDISEAPDLFPALGVVAGYMAGEVAFTHTRRLRLKESDRTAAMALALRQFGVRTENAQDEFTVFGRGGSFAGGGSFTAFGDHRIAMAIAVGSTVAESPITLDNPECAAKSYPNFFAEFLQSAVDKRVMRSGSDEIGVRPQCISASA